MATQPLAFRVAQALIDCLCAELLANEIADPTLKRPKFCCLRGGTDTILQVSDSGVDRCCQGEAYAKIVDIYPSASFPTPDEFRSKQCQFQRLTVAMELGIMRCYPVDPTCAQSTEAVRQYTADAEAAFRAVCCFAKAIKANDFVGPGVQWFASGWTPQGPDGGCVTASMPVFASIPGIGCC